MSTDPRLFDAVAGVFEYPGPGSADAARLAASLATDVPSLAAPLNELADWLEKAGPAMAEERYTGLFDLKPVCTLHLGYHLFGDTYARGELLAGLAGEQRRAGVVVEGDIPDFLPGVLRLVPRLEPESAALLVDTLVLPALGRMNKALEESKAPWVPLLAALPEFLAPLGNGNPEPDDSFPAKVEETEEALV